MLFNSLSFIVFFAVVLAVHNAPISWRGKKINLLVASYLFYAAWNPPFVILLWISTLVDWHVAKRLFAESRLGRRRALLLISLLVNLGMLGYFKYGAFLMENFQALMALIGIEYVAPEWNIILPVGISFYTFQTLAYTLDIYLKRSRPAKSMLDFSLFVTFFPQLVAGPIVRPSYLIPQFRVPHIANAKQMGWGLALMTIGMFNKVVIADGLLAPAADAAFGAGGALSSADAWLGTLAFSGQIFCDFAGYSTIAIGVALCLGFTLPDNFRFPYAAIGFSDFWRRWHISLSSWLRDYLYIPLGGNRSGAARTTINLMLTMLLGGLWHGASWTFVVWGGLHGIYLIGERILNARFGGRAFWHGLAGKAILGLITYFLINITWVFFRAQDFPTAWGMIEAMLFINREGGNVLSWLHVTSVCVVTLVMLSLHWALRDRTLKDAVSAIPRWLTAVTLGLMIWAIIITQGGGNAFIYFQF